jgi:hypothetical protein
MPLLGHLPQGHCLYIHTQRVMRWYQRLLDLYSGSVQQPPEIALDQMLVFFIFCHQLKDWVIKETNIPKPEVEGFITQNRCLAICADIANGTKHLGIGDNHTPRSGEDIRIREAYALTQDRHVVPRPIITMEDHTTIDIADLASDCIEKWNEFLTAHPQ